MPRYPLRTFALASLTVGVISMAGCSSSGDDDASGTGGAALGGSAGNAGSPAKGGSAAQGGSAGGKAGLAGDSGAAGRSASGGGAGRSGPGTGGTSGGSAGAGTSGGKGGRGGSSGANGGTGDAAGSGGDAGATSEPGGAGWLYTSGNEILVSDGNGGGTRWVGRGVNVDDIFLCGYNASLWMPDSEEVFTTILQHVITDWKATFIRLSLSLASFQTVSWFENEAEYKTKMSNAIQSIGTHPGVYVLVTVRSDSSMILHDDQHGPEPTGIPSSSTNTPDAQAFPRGTDALYEALVEEFADDPFVLFGLSNEPGGNLRSDQQIADAMSHAVSTIRAKEDALGVPHHLVAVQGNSWTSDIGTYGDEPLEQDNVIYEVHGYPPATDSYTYDNIPVIIGEYGSLSQDSADAFFADLEAKHIPSLAWDLEPYSNCAPDLVNVDYSPSNLEPSDDGWGAIVKGYLADHAN